MNEERIEFSFTAIQVISKTLYPLIEQEVIPTVFNYEIKVETRVQPEKRFVINNIIVVIRDDGKAEKICAEFQIWCYYQVIDFDNIIKKNEDGLYLVPDILEQTIRPISISTTRGLIHADLRNTYLQSSIMPIIFMTEFNAEVK